MYSNTIYSIVPNTFLFVGVARNTYALPQTWFIVILTTTICILPIFAFRYIKQLKHPSEAFQAKQNYKHWKNKGMYEDHETTNYELPRETHLRRTLTRQSMNRLRDKQTKLTNDRRQAEDEVDHIRKVERQALNANINQAMDVDPDAQPGMNNIYDRPESTRSDVRNGLRMGDLIQSGIIRRSTRRKVNRNNTKSSK